jgi:hypothetical protein
VQVGAPSDRAQYVHRVGRTARAGKEGAALLVLCEFEQAFLRQVWCGVVWAARGWPAKLLQLYRSHQAAATSVFSGCCLFGVPDSMVAGCLPTFCVQVSDLPLLEAPQLPYESRDEALKAVGNGLARISYDTKCKAYVSSGPFHACPSTLLPHTAWTACRMIPSTTLLEGAAHACLLATFHCNSLKAALTTTCAPSLIAAGCLAGLLPLLPQCEAEQRGAGRDGQPLCGPAGLH